MTGDREFRNPEAEAATALGDAARRLSIASHRQRDEEVMERQRIAVLSAMAGLADEFGLSNLSGAILAEANSFGVSHG